MPLILGIDEAGRGPVVGPLVIAGALISDSSQNKLVRLRLKDSKLLTQVQREKAFDKITKVLEGHQILVIDPAEIDRAVNGHDGLNLNWLEAQKTVEIIDKFGPDIVYIDCPSTNVGRYKDYVLGKIQKKNAKLVAEHKADTKYPIVSAASILAKVTRDREIEKMQQNVADPIGSGYPSDPVTVEFLKKNYAKYPRLFRKSWRTYQSLGKGKKQRKLDEF